jgi:hypothetical protein
MTYRLISMTTSTALGVRAVLAIRVFRPRFSIGGTKTSSESSLSFFVRQIRKLLPGWKRLRMNLCLEVGIAEEVAEEVAAVEAEVAGAEETCLGITGLPVAEALVVLVEEAMEAIALPAMATMVVVAAVLVGMAEVVEAPSRGGKPFAIHTSRQPSQCGQYPRDNPLVFPDPCFDTPGMRPFPKISRKVPKKHRMIRNTSST